MNRFSNAAAHVSVVLTMAVCVVSSARAVSIQGYFGHYSKVAQVKGLLLSLTAEINRNIYLKRTAQAACLSENFIPVADRTNGFDIIVRGLLDSTKKVC